jgi:hemolysin activation/secretion protein
MLASQAVPGVVASLLVALLLAAAPSHAQQAGDATTATPAAPLRVPVRGFKVTGNTLLPESVVAATLERYKGERTLDELKQAASAVQGLYAKAGYGAVVAFLPEQSAAEGIVEIRVVQGRLTQVTVERNAHFSERNIRSSLPALKIDATPNLKLVDAQVQMANENPSKQVQVLLQPGDTLGQAQAKITVNDRAPMRWWAGLDNTGDEQTGRVRANAGWQHANLFDRDHVVAVQAQVSAEHPGDSYVLSAAYRVPFYETRLQFDAFAAYAAVDGGTTATLAGGLTFTGKGRFFGTRLTRLLDRWREYDQRVSLSFDHRDYVNNCAIAGLPPGACGPTGESVTVQPLGLEYAVRGFGTLPLSVAVSIQHNLQLGGSHSSDEAFEAVRPGAKPRYTLLRLAASGGVANASDWQVQGRLNTQWTGDGLVPSEQFGIGGLYSVRGYDERELAGDRGASGSVEFASPNLRRAIPASAGEMRVVAFADAGSVQNRLQTPCLEARSSCNLSSVGLGARYQQSSINAGLYVAYALKDALRTSKHDTRVHFYISYAP